MVIDAHLHLWNTERLHYQWLQPPEAVLGGTAIRCHTLAGPALPARETGDNGRPVT